MKENFYHDKSKTKYLNMINGGRAIRNSKGEIIRDAVYQKRKCKQVSRIEPNRKWFNNTKTITENELENFRNQVQTKSVYHVLLSQGKLPYSLLKPKDGKRKRINDYDQVFGKKATRKKPKVEYTNLEELVNVKDKQLDEKEKIKGTYVKGQSRRIWNELYKVMDSSDVIVHVLDARDPLGTRCDKVEAYVEESKQKHLIYVLNKVDLVPTGVTAKWLKHFSSKHPIVAYHSSSLTNFYGKNNLTNLLRQFATLHKEKKEISVGFVGYPNVGKSSIINTLKKKKVCSVAPVPGQTKVWQYIALSGRIYLVDCPGIVPITDEKDAVLRGAVRIENVIDPEIYVEEIVKKARSKLEQVYSVDFVDTDDFLEKIAIRFGKLLKNGERDVSSAAKIVLHDWCKGKIPYFLEPPVQDKGIEVKK